MLLQSFIALAIFATALAFPRLDQPVPLLDVQRLAAGWQRVLTREESCDASCHYMSLCAPATNLQVSSLQNSKIFHKLLLTFVEEIRATCGGARNGSLQLDAGTPNTFTCLECFLFGDLLKFVTQNFFGGWLEATVIQVLEAISFLPGTDDVYQLVTILFQALRESSGAIYTDFGGLLGCPPTLDALSQQCCGGQCPPP
ncbi:unnamed protein product, partial [Mesorhabditis spiculigera]